MDAFTLHDLRPSHLWPKAEDRTRTVAANLMAATAGSADSVRTLAGS
jgi:hypothetical protein